MPQTYYWITYAIVGVVVGTAAVVETREQSDWLLVDILAWLYAAVAWPIFLGIRIGRE